MFEYISLPDSTPQRHAATIPGIKLSHLVHLPIGSGNSGISPDEKRLQREGQLILGYYTPTDKSNYTSFKLYKLSEDYNLTLTKSELLKGPDCRCLRRTVK